MSLLKYPQAVVVEEEEDTDTDTTELCWSNRSSNQHFGVGFEKDLKTESLAPSSKI